jgi:hypothetical protein
MKKLLLVFAILPALLFSQTRKQRKALEAQKKADQQVITNLKNHTQFFTDKNSQQAIADSKNDELVLEYISNQFRTIGIQPKGTNGYIQQYKIDDGKQIEAGTSLKVNGTVLAVKKDYFPLVFSASKSASGMPAMALRERDVPWFADVKDWIDESTKDDSDINKTIVKEAERAALKGATALFLYNSSNLADNISFNKRDKTTPLSIPVIYITPAGYNKYFTDPSQILDIELNVVLKDATKMVKSIVGYIDNGATSNILIATPYDRINPEEDGPTASVNTLDDIISGRSMLIELARMLSKSKAKNNNYTFIGYSSEDSLSKDSKWLNNSAITSNANYIINLDKVGRYNEDKKLVISTYGTTPDLLESIKPLADNNLEISFDSTSLAGRGSSGYPLKVPVLNFFTASGINNSSAQAANINYEGELNIARFIYRVIEATDGKGKLAFRANIGSSIMGNQTSVSAMTTAQPK